MNTVILTKVKAKSTNDAIITTRASNNWIIYEIRLCDVYVCDESHDELLETIFSRKELNYDKFILEGEVGSSDNESECN